MAIDCRTQYGIEIVTKEDVGKLASSYPDRFIPFASVDPSMGRLAIDRLIHTVKKYGCRGLKLVPPVQKFDFSYTKFFPLWEVARESDIIV